jgi:outer membrane phospholipase A
MKNVSINLKISKGEILNELTRRTSYTALAVAPTQAEDGGEIDKIVLTSDDYPWCSDKFSSVFFRLQKIFSPFSSAGERFSRENETEMSFQIRMTSKVQESVLHYTKEIIISYILSQWYLERSLEKSQYLANQCENLITLLQMVMNSQEKKHRPINYF